jgi:hypothetical protein
MRKQPFFQVKERRCKRAAEKTFPPPKEEETWAARNLKSGQARKNCPSAVLRAIPIINLGILGIYIKIKIMSREKEKKVGQTNRNKNLTTNLTNHTNITNFCFDNLDFTSFFFCSCWFAFVRG